MFEYNFNFVKNFPHLMFSRFSEKQIYSDEFFYINFFLFIIPTAMLHSS